MDAQIRRLVEAARHRRECFHVAASSSKPDVVRRLGTEPDQSRGGRLRPGVGRRLLVAVVRRPDVELVVARRAAGRRRAQLEVHVDDAVPAVVARRRSGRRLVHRKRLRH